MWRSHPASWVAIPISVSPRRGLACERRVYTIARIGASTGIIRGDRPFLEAMVISLLVIAESCLSDARERLARSGAAWIRQHRPMGMSPPGLAPGAARAYRPGWP